MNVHFFTKGNNNVPSSRQRAHLLAKELQKYQVDTVVHIPPVEVISQTPWPSKFFLIFQVMKSLLQTKKGDVIFLQRTIYNKYFLVLIFLHHFLFHRKIIFDFDDAIYLHSPFKTKTLVKIADVVTVGSHELFDWAKRYNEQTFLIPTCTYFTSYPLKKFVFEKKEKIVLGWVGDAPAHHENLSLLVPVFKELSRRKVPVDFVLVGTHGDREILDMFQSIDGINVRMVEWLEPEKIVMMIHTFDVGLMPLTDTPWNRGKCALKAIEYMACGVPAIASPVGENNYVIDNGVNGFLVSTTEEWVSTIEKLSKNYGSLKDLGARARKTVEESYIYDVQLIRILDIMGK